MRIFHFTMMEFMFGVVWVFTILPSILFLRNNGGKEAFQTEATVIVGFHGLMVLTVVVYVLVSLWLWSRRKKASAPITAQLQKMGFRFLPWRARRKFGDGKEETTADPNGFSLVERPRGSWHRGRYQGSTDPAGIAVLDQNDCLVELHNSGQMVFIDQHLLHVTVETPWTIWSVESGRKEDKRPRSLLHVKGDLWMTLILIYLGRCDSSKSRWMEDTGLRRARTFESLLPDASQGLESFDSGSQAFDGFFNIRTGGPKVRKLLTNSPELGDLVEPVRHWQEALFDLHVAERIEAWVDVRRFASWDDLGDKLPRLIADLTTFATRLDAILLHEDA